MKKEQEFSKEELKLIISALENLKTMYEFVRGFGMMKQKEIDLRDLINKIKKYG
ncbi:hypothetical protein M0R01_04575 [bacterium]|nr:hypothetical protein [bacterium]